MIDDLKLKLSAFIKENEIKRCKVNYFHQDAPATVVMLTREELSEIQQNEFFKLVSEFSPFHIGRTGELPIFSCLWKKHQFIDIGSNYERISYL
ncbi:hypothetical protein BM525_20930 (plasmid) [Alteromonas mediterranea]|uniref:Uncharacterized protein n=1 Tax=Alteromonas mediterranea TaxID=314275 RepID=A0AAC9NU07_9ALTE|nr:hypothetical protein [Alteromonas mediterranea]APD92326.1 hypothetical protein BM524_20705 [Alteromonas mediterranea]APE00187.1 hypothetical protein BM525_20930 [Alteromonas mediterranea]